VVFDFSSAVEAGVVVGGACVDVDASADPVDILEYLVVYSVVDRSELQGLA
jgi:hypothetical protein